jgi:hypothetical protein
MKELENIISELVSMNRRLANNFKTEEGKKLRSDLFDITQRLERYKQDQALQLLQTGVMRCSSKDIDKFYNDTMYTDQTNYYGVIQKTNKGDYVRWKQPSQMIKDFMRWKKNNA